VFNGSATIARTVDSVLAQHPSVDEIVVVNDGSTDATLECVPQDPRVRVISQENQGEGAARNTGIDAARGPLVFFVDADDLWLPGHVETNLELFQRTRGRGLLYCSLYARKAGGKLKRARWWGTHAIGLKSYLVHLFLWRSPISSSSVAISKPVWTASV
jgi:glycosyltransferase involved in cell wall biosynthesis